MAARKRAGHRQPTSTNRQPKYVRRKYLEYLCTTKTGEGRDDDS